jgi:hypothetical protein
VAGPSPQPEEIATQAFHEHGRKFPQTVMRTLPTVALREFDYSIEVRKTHGPGHYTVQLPGFSLEYAYDPTYHRDRASFSPYDHNTVFFDQLADLFGPPMPNPVRYL